MARWKAGPLAFCLLAALGCGREIELDPRSSTSTKAASAAPAPATARAVGEPLVAVLYAEREADTRTRIDGIVERVLVDLGDRVSAGQLLAVLRDDREAAQVSSAQAAYEMTKAEHDRAVELRKKELVTQSEVDQAVYKFKTAEAAQRDAQAQLEYTRIRAPFAGVVAHRHVRPGQPVEEGDPIVRVTAPRPLRAELLVPEVEAGRVAIGDRVGLRHADGSTGSAAVTRIAPVVDPVSGTIEILLEVRDAGKLRPGSAVTVELPVTVRKAP
jgi:membrane fusion protein, multidrug efflux system